MAQDHRAIPAAGQRRRGAARAPLLDARPSPALDAAIGVSGYGLRIGSRVADFLQLAHYHRMLEACGFGAAASLRRRHRDR